MSSDVTLTRGFKALCHELLEPALQRSDERRRSAGLDCFYVGQNVNFASKINKPARLLKLTSSSRNVQEVPATYCQYHDLFVELYQQVISRTVSDGGVAPAIERFVALGGDLGAKSETGTTLLYECIRLELHDGSKLLLNSVAPLDARDSHATLPCTPPPCTMGPVAFSCFCWLVQTRV